MRQGIYATLKQADILLSQMSEGGENEERKGMQEIELIECKPMRARVTHSVCGSRQECIGCENCKGEVTAKKYKWVNDPVGQIYKAIRSHHPVAGYIYGGKTLCW